MEEFKKEVEELKLKQIRNIIEKSHNKELLAKKINEIINLLMDVYELAFESGYNLAINLESDE